MASSSMAVAGEGVTVAQSALMALNLKAVRLINLPTETVLAPLAYWAFSLRDTAESPNVLVLHNWLLGNAKNDQAAAFNPAT